MLAIGQRQMKPGNHKYQFNGFPKLKIPPIQKKLIFPGGHVLKGNVTSKKNCSALDVPG